MPEEQRLVSAAVIVKRYSELDPFGKAEPTEAEYSDAMQRLAANLRDICSKHHVAGWKEDDELQMRLVNSDDLSNIRLITLRGSVTMRRTV